MTTFTEKKLSTANATIHYVEGPVGGAPLLVLHGFSARWQAGLPFLTLMALRYHVYAPDMRGHGRSSRTPGAYSLADDVDDMIALLKDVVGKPAVVVGSSYGGVVATAVAARAPEWVRGLLLVDPPLAEMTYDKAHMEPFRVWYTAVRELIVRDDSLGEKLVAMVDILPDVDELTRHRQLAQWLQFDPERILWFTEGRMTGDLRLTELLPQITCPALLLQCDPDQSGALDHPTAELTLKLLSHCIYLNRPDLPHSVVTAHPLELAQMVTDFAELL